MSVGSTVPMHTSQPSASYNRHTYILRVIYPMYSESVQLCDCFRLCLTEVFMHLNEADEVFHDGNLERCGLNGRLTIATDLP